MENIEEIFNEILACDVKEALKYSKDGFKESGNPEFLIYTAHCYLVQGFYEEAIAAVDLAFELGCNYFVYGYNVKGEAFLSWGLYVESRKCFEKVISEEPEQYLANTFLIELDIREGFYEDAINKCVDYIENLTSDEHGTKYNSLVFEIDELKANTMEAVEMMMRALKGERFCL